MSPVTASPALRRGLRPLNGLLLASLLTASAPASADFSLSDCKRGVRDSTAVEIDFMHRAPAALAAYLPRPPQYMSLASAPLDFKQPAPVKWQTCKEFREGHDLGATIGANYRLEYPREEADRLRQQVRAVEAEIARIEALPPEKEAQRQKLLGEMRAAYDAAPRRQRKDPPFTPEQQALSDKQQAEGRRLEQAAQQVITDHRKSVEPQTAPLKAQRDALNPGMQTFLVKIEMNAWHVDSPDGLNWGAAKPDGAALGATVGNVVVTVQGPAGPARTALLASFDRAGLQGLVGKPLPTLARSEATWTAAQAKPAVTLAQAESALPGALAAPGAPAAGAAPTAVAQPSVTPGSPTSASATARAAAQPASGPANPPASPPAPREEQKKTEPTTTTQDAANAVNKLRGLLGR
jgi:hypothetical protein